MTDQPKNKIPTDPNERKEYFRKIGSKGGQNSATSDKAVRPFRDNPELAKKAGSRRGYTFKRKKPTSE